jgi:hypothetical protein
MAASVRTLKETLGDDAMGGLENFVDDAGRRWKDEVLALAGDRFDRRLGEEIGALRLDMAKEFATVRVETAKEFAAVRGEIVREFAAVRGEMAKEFSAVRIEMADMRADLRTEISAMGAGLRGEMAATRFGMLKWAFLFWVGQVAAMTGIMTLLLRAMMPR